MIQRFSIWQKWLFGGSLLIAAFGLSLALFNQAPLYQSLFDEHIHRGIWGAGRLVGRDTVLQRWIYGILGASVCGWGFFMAFISHTAFDQRERWTWYCFMTGFPVWLVVDSSLALYLKLWANVALNALLLAALGIPFLFTARDFLGLPEK